MSYQQYNCIYYQKDENGVFVKKLKTFDELRSAQAFVEWHLNDDNYRLVSIDFIW